MPQHLNVEIKAACKDPDHIRQYLLSQGADFRGTDLQSDTYFKVKQGRLKLRQGNIENSLIYYERNNQAGPKSSSFDLFPVTNPGQLCAILAKSIGILIVVKKEREIYYIGNVKFHIDRLEGLGSFVEIEAGNLLADLDREALQAQCTFYLKEFRIAEQDLVSVSYSDMLLKALPDDHAA
jgi:predicted adenylyl cyclase CyaB